MFDPDEAGPAFPWQRGAAVAALDGLAALTGVSLQERAIARGKDVLRQGDEPNGLHVLTSGLACRYRVLRDGGRQITAILVPGDLCDLEAVLRGRADYAVAGLTACTVGQLPAAQLASREPVGAELMAALMTRVLRDAGIARAWIVGMGRRSSEQRLAHLLCELRERLAQVGLAQEASYELHVTQEDLADALGLTSVHVNRVLQSLRGAGLITLKGGLLVMHDRPALERLAEFDPAYLQP